MGTVEITVKNQTNGSKENGPRLLLLNFASKEASSRLIACCDASWLF